MRKKILGLNYAIRGLVICSKTERNMKIHLFITLAVLVYACYRGLVLWKWALLIMTISLVLITEMINTAVESAVDLCTLDDHPLAQKAKDVAAGAVLLAALNAIIMGMLIFFI